MKKKNFYAGPSMLDSGVLREAIAQIENEKKLSILEISHRSDEIVALFEETKNLVRSVMDLSTDKEVLFLHGGASLQFAMIPMNVKEQGAAGFVDTGVWTLKAIKEAKKLRNVAVIASGEAEDYTKIPKFDTAATDNLDYLHITTNNTIYGTQYHKIPSVKVPLVADMSSDIFCRTLDFDAFDLIFAGFQKNLGTTGGCLVVLDKKILNDDENLLSMLDYKVHIKAKSMFNTPPVFSVLLCNLTLKWIVAQGGLVALEKVNQEKAALLYDEIERNSLFYSKVTVADRSLMNVCFDAMDDDIIHRFLSFCAQKDIVGIGGHRTRGGFRASMYNSMPLEDVAYLVAAMKTFERQYS